MGERRFVLAAALRALRPGVRLRFFLIHNGIGAIGIACWFWRPWIGALIFGAVFLHMGLWAILALTMPAVAKRYFKEVPLASEVRSELLLYTIGVLGGVGMFVLSYAEWVEAKPF